MIRYELKIICWLLCTLYIYYIIDLLCSAKAQNREWDYWFAEDISLIQLYFNHELMEFNIILSSLIIHELHETCFQGFKTAGNFRDQSQSNSAFWWFKFPCSIKWRHKQTSGVRTLGCFRRGRLIMFLFEIFCNQKWKTVSLIQYFIVFIICSVKVPRWRCLLKSTVLKCMKFLCTK